MIHSIALSGIVLAAMAQPPDRADSTGAWRMLHTVAGPDQWLTAAWLGEGGAWFAGGKNILLTGRDESAKETAVPRTVVYRFGEDSSGRVVAVGLRAMVWEQDGDGFRLVHQSPSPPRKGRASYGELLYGIGYLDPSSAETLIAYGPNDLIAYRLASGAWETKRDSTLASWALIGPPKPALPRGCDRLYWHWLSRKEAFLSCDDGRSYLVSNDQFEAAGRLPAACKDDVSAVARDKTALYLSCGSHPSLWVHKMGQPPWDRVQGAPSGIRSVVAKDGCVLLVTDNQVWRRCGVNER